MAERDIVAAILRLLKKTPGCFCWKEHGGMYGTAGIPDIIACVGGRFVAFEVKTETGRLPSGSVPSFFKSTQLSAAARRKSADISGATPLAAAGEEAAALSS